MGWVWTKRNNQNLKVLVTPFALLIVILWHLFPSRTYSTFTTSIHLRFMALLISHQSPPVIAAAAANRHTWPSSFNFRSAKICRGKSWFPLHFETRVPPEVQLEGDGGGASVRFGALKKCTAKLIIIVGGTNWIEETVEKPRVKVSSSRHILTHGRPSIHLRQAIYNSNFFVSFIKTAPTLWRNGLAMN